MPDDVILNRLRALLAEHSGASETSLSSSSTPQNTDGWDSVANLGLMAAVEEEFNVTVSTRDAMRLKSLGDIARFLAEAQKPR